MIQQIIKKLHFVTRRAEHGFSLMEIIVALAIFAVVVGSMSVMITGNFNALTRGGEQTVAQALAQEGIEAVRSIRDRSWNELEYSPAQVTFVGGQWELISATSELIDNKYTRQILIEDVCRDGTHAQVVCPGTYTDALTKNVTVIVSWSVPSGATNSVQQTALFSNWEKSEWQQTNWSGGSGQSIWVSTNQYDSDNSNVDVTTTAGQVSLAQAPQGTWLATDRTEISHTSETDFSGGTFSNTVVEGIGDSANVVLDTETTWTEHSQSGSITVRHLNAVYAISENNVWAGGNNGEMLNYNGSTWTTSTLPSAGHVRAIHAFSASDVWVSGHGGKIWQYNGSSWSLNADTGSEEWNGIAMLSATDGWVGGKAGSIAQYNGTSWTVSSVPSPSDINDIAAVTSSNVWAVGNSGKIWNYNGTSWVLHSTVGSNNWNDIVMVSATEGWVVGTGGSSAYFNGTTWTQETVDATADIIGVEVLRTDSVWAVGNNGRIWEYDGTAWAIHTDNGGDHLNAITIDSALYMWAVGNGGYIIQGLGTYLASGTFESAIIDSSEQNSTWDYLTWNETIPSGADLTVAVRTGNTGVPDGTWTAWSSELSLGDALSIADGQYLQYRITFTRGTSQIESPQLHDITFIYNAATVENINAVDAVASNSMWGAADNGVIVSYDGSNWSEFQDTGSQNWNDIEMISSTEGWVVGDSGALGYLSSGVWTTSTIASPDTINGLDVYTSNNVWAVGAGGSIWQYNGTSWGLQTDTGAQTWNAIAMIDDEEGWAVGENGALAEYDEGTWTTSTISGGDTINDVYVLSENNIWAVGENGRIWNYDGSNWTLHTDTGSQVWHSISFVNSSTGWVVGEEGEMYSWDGSTWASYSSPTARDLHGVSIISTGGAAVGDLGEILQMPSGGLYEQTGTLVSSAYDMGDASSLHAIEWTEQIPTCTPECAITFQIRTAPDSSGSPGTWTSWYGASGLGTYFTESTGSIIPSALNGNQWMQYQFELQGDGSNTPILEDVTIGYN